MSSVLCCEDSGRRLLPLLLCLLLLMSCDAARINRSAFMDGDVRSEVVDPNNRTIWTMFNLTDGQISRIRSGSNSSGKDETTQATQNRLLDHLAGQRLKEIRSRIRIAVSNNPNDEISQNAAGQDAAGKEIVFHEKAGYPICNGETSTLNWQQSNNVTLQFASSVFQTNDGNIVDSAILRLYKMNPKAAVTTNVENAATATPAATVAPVCQENFLESQIRVTVSIVHQQKKKQRKKRTCNTMMLNSSKIGWVDIDVKCALNYWSQQQHAAAQQPMHPHPPIVVGLLMIEVHDDEEHQLLPGLYFQPPTCDQAGLAVPWSIHGSATTLPSMENYTLSKCPRLDMRYTGNGQLSFKKFNSTPRELLNTESTTLNSPTIDNKLENSQNESQEKEQIHHHRKRHHHSQQQQQQQQHQMPDCWSTDSEDASQQSETQHHLRAHHNHHHHHNHNHHNHHKHRHVIQNEE